MNCDTSSVAFSLIILLPVAHNRPAAKLFRAIALEKAQLVSLYDSSNTLQHFEQTDRCLPLSRNLRRNSR